MAVAYFFSLHVVNGALYKVRNEIEKKLTAANAIKNRENLLDSVYGYGFNNHGFHQRGVHWKLESTHSNLY